MKRFTFARTLALATAALTLGGSLARAEVIWRGDFSTGDTSQWTGREAMSDDRLQVVKDPLGQDREVLQATVHQGDDPIGASGNRNELFYSKDQLEGQERYYHWQTMWPKDYASEDTWQLFTQWHHFDGGGSPPMEFYVWGEQVRLMVLNEDPVNALWTTPLERGTWHDFVFHVNWSSDPKKGFVELWYDGKIAIPKHYASTLFPGQGVYLKQGLYRKETIQPTQTIFHTGMTVGTTLDDVWPQTPKAPATTADSTPPASSTEGTAAASNLESGPGSVNVQAGCDQVGYLGLAPLGALAALLLRRRRRMAL